MYFKGKDNKELTEWFSLLKDRVIPQPKQEWKQENTGDLTDFENAMMHIGNSFFGQYAGLDPNDTNVIKEQANLLLELVPKQEWGEEDDFMVATVENSFYLHCGQMTDKLSEQYKKFFEKVKSLRPQNTWKPSDEQIETLEHFVRSVSESGYASPYDNGTKLIYSLLEQLKQL